MMYVQLVNSAGEAIGRASQYPQIPSPGQTVVELDTAYTVTPAPVTWKVLDCSPFGTHRVPHVAVERAVAATAPSKKEQGGPRRVVKG